MAARLNISQEVADLIGNAGVADLYSARETSTVGCGVCGGQVLPEWPEVLEVVSYRSPDRVVAQFAHSGCGRSRIVDVAPQGPPEEASMSWP